MKGVFAVFDKARNSSAALKYGSLEGSCMHRPPNVPSERKVDVKCGGAAASA